jgi:hypothetical protein
MVWLSMPLNKLRRQAEQFLRLAREAHDEGRSADAHAHTLKVTEYLEGAVSLEELRQRLSPKAARKKAARKVQATKRRTVRRPSGSVGHGNDD